MHKMKYKVNLLYGNVIYENILRTYMCDTVIYVICNYCFK